MPVFEYTALNPGGERTTGVLNGSTEQAVLAELESRRLVPVSIRARAERARGGLGGRGRVSARRLGTTYLQLSDLLRAGVPLLRSMRLLANRRSSARLGEVLRDMTEAVSQGTELSEAMARHTGVFPRVHIAMVRAGERGGFLEQVMARLGQFVMGQAELRSKVVGNLVYPFMLVAFGLVVLTLIFGIFVPRFKPVFFPPPESGKVVDVPLISHIVFGAGDLVASYGLYTLAATLVALAILWRLSRRPDARRKLDELRTRMPVLGPIVRLLAAARFCRMLGTMLANGVPMLTAMQIAREAAGNTLMEEAIDGATEAVRAGQPLAGPLGESGLFDEDVLEMIVVGESANNLDEVLTTIAGTIETRVDRLLTTAVRLLEPLMLVAIALVIGFVAAGLILPMTRLKAGF
ncbi:MAG: type II secretion system F family protein [Phycisphaerales bacterium]